MHIAGITAHPTGAWVTQQARNLLMATTLIVRTDHSINTRQPAALPRTPERPFDRCDEIGSAA